MPQTKIKIVALRFRGYVNPFRVKVMSLELWSVLRSCGYHVPFGLRVLSIEVEPKVSLAVLLWLHCCGCTAVAAKVD